METNVQQGLPALEVAAQATVTQEEVNAVIEDSETNADNLSFVKRRGDFYVEFFETEKKLRVKGSEVASSLLSYIEFFEVYPEVKAKPGRKKKNQTQERGEPEAWLVTINFHDDVNNEAQQFVNSLVERDSPFKIRIVQTDRSGDPVEAVLLKNCQVTQSSPKPISRHFDADSEGLRSVQVHVRAESLSHKHF